MKVKSSVILNLWLVSLVANSVLLTVPYQGMHTFDIAGIPVGYLPFIICFIIFLIVGKFKIDVQNLKMTLSLLGIMLYGIFSLLWVVDYKSWFVYFIMWVIYISSFLIISYFIRKSLKLKGLITFIKRMVLVGGLISACGLFRFFILHFPDANPWPLINRNGYIYFIIPLVPLLFALRDSGTLMSLTFVILLCLICSGILLTFSRMGFIGLCVSILGYLLFKNRSYMNLTIRILSLVVLFMIFFTLVPRLSGKLNTTTKTIISILEVGGVQKGEADYRRFLLMHESLRIFKEHRLLGTGMGLDNYLFYFEGDTVPAKPHSLYLSYLAEFGLVGFTFLFLFLMFLTISLYNPLRLIRSSRELLIGKAFFIGHISILIMFIFNEYITAPFVWFYWSMAISFSLLYATNTIQEHKRFE